MPPENTIATPFDRKSWFTALMVGVVTGVLGAGLTAIAVAIGYVAVNLT